MITRRTLLIAGTAALAVGLPVAAGAASQVVTGQALGAVNAYRAANGRGAVSSDPVLGQAAAEHAIAMARSGRLGHDRFRARMRRNGISGSAAENVAVGQADIAAVLAAWQRSRGHRRNLLGGFSRVGLAVARDPASGNRPYWTMILAK